MNRELAVLLYVGSGFLTAYAQIILKKEAVKNSSENGMKRILHTMVFIAYLIMLSTIVINMLAMRYISYKYVPILSTFSYVFVFFLERGILHEKIDRKGLCGIIFILTGIAVFYLK